jgi:hypothetical protein
MARNWRSYFANDSEDDVQDNLNPTFQRKPRSVDELSKSYILTEEDDVHVSEQ